MIRRTLLRAVLFVVCVVPGLAAYADAVWIDVRTSVEHSMDSIEGDPRIPHGDIVEGVTELYPDKDTEIHLYCRSGGRAGKAAEALRAAGYSDVSNDGGIDEARQARGLLE